MFWDSEILFYSFMIIPFCPCKFHQVFFFSPVFIHTFQCVCVCFLLLLSCYVVSDSLWSHELHHTRFPCLLLSPWVCSNSLALSQWGYPTILSSDASFSCPQSFQQLGLFKRVRSWYHGQSIGASASAKILFMNIQGWFTLGLTGLHVFTYKLRCSVVSDSLRPHGL